MILRGWLVTCVLLGSLAVAAAQGTREAEQARQDVVVRMNQIQVIGTHNSYHAGFAPSEAKLMQAKNPKAFEDLDYSHQPLAEQLFIWSTADRAGRVCGCKGRSLRASGDHGHGGGGAPSCGPGVGTPEHLLDKPGFKVMHVVGIDQRSTCSTFVVCLKAVKAWSQANPRHLPLFILVETKQDKPGEVPKPYAVATEPFAVAVFDALEAEILSVFSRDQIVTPDEVRGTRATLPEAIQAGGWPTLKDARGKVVFLLDQASVTAVYTDGASCTAGQNLRLQMRSRGARTRPLWSRTTARPRRSTRWCERDIWFEREPMSRPRQREQTTRDGARKRCNQVRRCFRLITRQANRRAGQGTTRSICRAERLRGAIR